MEAFVEHQRSGAGEGSVANDVPKNCSFMTVPVRGGGEARDYEELITNGFLVEWETLGDCSACSRSGGECRFDEGSFRCVCHDGLPCSSRECSLQEKGITMANIARDNLDVIRIPRKVILAELIKKLGGREAEYKCWVEDGRYLSIVRTVIGTIEPNTSGRLEQAIGSLEDTKDGAEEAAAIALIQLLKRNYRFEIDDMNLVERAKAEHKNEQFEKRHVLSTIIEKKQDERIKKLRKCCNQLLHDMDFVQGACDDICSAAAVTLSAHDRSSPLTDMMYSVGCLYEWTEQKIYENTDKINQGNEKDNMFQR